MSNPADCTIGDSVQVKKYTTSNKKWKSGASAL